MSVTNTPRKLNACPAPGDNLSVSQSSYSISSLSSEHLCRICHENEEKEDLFSHCQCKGSVGLSHTACLLLWIKKSGSVRCELCKKKYVTIAELNKRFWQWTKPRIGTKGWFKLVFCAGFLSMLFAFTTWIIWTRTSSSLEAEEERNKRQVEYSYVVYGMLVLIAIVGMYALSFRPFVRFVSRCIVMNQRITVIPNGELCKERASSIDTFDRLDMRGKADESCEHTCARQHNSAVSLKGTYVQVMVVDDASYGARGYTKLAGGEEMNVV